MRCQRRTLVLTAVGLLASALQAQRIAGPPIAVSGVAHAADEVSPQAVGVDAQGGFAVVWSRSGAFGGLALRLFRPDGTPRTQPIHFSTGQGRIERGGAARLTMAPDGSFVVVWPGAVAPSTKARVFVRRFDRNGRALGPATPVATQLAAGNQFEPDVARTADGGFAVVWGDENGALDEEGAVANDLRLRLFDAAGRPRGAPITMVHNGLENDAPRIATAPGGGFAVSFQTYLFESSFFDVFVVGLGPDGSQRASLRANDDDTASSSQFDAALAFAPSGRLMVTWTDRAGDPSTSPAGFEAIGVVGQVFGPDFSRVGANLHVNQTQAGEQRESSVVGRNGGFLVSWTGGPSGALEGWRSYMRSFTALGQPVGGEQKITPIRGALAIAPRLALRFVGKGVIAWCDASAELAESQVVSQRIEPR